MGIFGWSYPPGAENDPNAPYNQDDGPCYVCGQCLDDCVCPECPVCEAPGDPKCYEEHGLIRSFAQVALKAEAERFWEEEARSMGAYADELQVEVFIVDEEMEYKEDLRRSTDE